MKQIEFRLSLGEAGPPLWYVRSPQMKGLLATGDTIPRALESAARCIRDLALANAHAHAEGKDIQPIFQPLI